MSIVTLEDLFLHTLKDVLYAERKVLKVLPKMERAATDDTLKTAFADHRAETEAQIMRLEEVFEMIGKPARGAKCDAMIGLIEETEGLMAEIDDGETMDAALIASAQAVEHYEIARYGTLIAWAKQLGHADAAALMQTSLDEEYSADRLLSKMAESQLNKAAAAACERRSRAGPTGIPRRGTSLAPRAHRVPQTPDPFVSRCHASPVLRPSEPVLTVRKATCSRQKAWPVGAAATFSGPLSQVFSGTVRNFVCGRA